MTWDRFQWCAGILGMVGHISLAIYGFTYLILSILDGFWLGVFFFGVPCIVSVWLTVRISGHLDEKLDL